MATPTLPDKSIMLSTFLRYRNSLNYNSMQTVGKLSSINDK